MRDDNGLQSLDARELVLTRLMDVRADKLFRCWTEAELIKQWFAPLPWTVPVVEIDVRAGGASRMVMRGPEGEEVASNGVYLEIVPNRKIVFTDAYGEGWMPSDAPFFTGIITFEDEGGKTRYTARARHWTRENRDAHEQMGFHEGWGKCAEQMEALAATL